MTKFREQLKAANAELMKTLNLTNVNALPKVLKVSVNAGLSRGLKDAKFIDAVESTLTRITGQKPVRTKAKKSISNFKIREGMVVGMVVTIRGPRMEHFLEKLIHITLPRVRDFQGISQKAVDNQGNLTIGFKEMIAFPEIRTDEVDNLHGLEVTIATNAGTKERGLALLKALGIPFKK